MWLFILCKFDFMVRFFIIGLWFLLGNFLFFVNGFLIWVFYFILFYFYFFNTRILKFQRVAHNLFDKLLVWLCMIKLTWVCATSHCVVVSLCILCSSNGYICILFGSLETVGNSKSGERNESLGLFAFCFILFFCIIPFKWIEIVKIHI